MKLYLLFLLTLVLPITQIYASSSMSDAQAAAAAAQIEIATSSDSDDCSDDDCSDFDSNDAEASKEDPSCEGDHKRMNRRHNLCHKIYNLPKAKLDAFFVVDPKRVNITDREGDSILCGLIRRDKWSKINTTLKYNPDVHKSSGRCDALYCAAASRNQKSFKVVKKLVKMRANPSSQSNDVAYEQALEFAEEDVDFLIDAPFAAHPLSEEETLRYAPMIKLQEKKAKFLKDHRPTQQKKQ